MTEDDEPVDNLFSLREMRLLTEPLKESWNPGRPFMAEANCGVFRAVRVSPVVPDAFLSMAVEEPADLSL